MNEKSIWDKPLPEIKNPTYVARRTITREEFEKEKREKLGERK